ncbi:unnamed protein product [Protopolystoma xenopodis]|uniref:Uncharacterized protein n=1 Tax=Protopolystoma xenopodis TaxID=117903 RepID=A0A448WP53_9PLAT|nr:unnamed protein product [Protopolystoma xenopodis]
MATWPLATSAHVAGLNPVRGGAGCCRVESHRGEGENTALRQMTPVQHEAVESLTHTTPFSAYTHTCELTGHASPRNTIHQKSVLAGKTASIEQEIRVPLGPTAASGPKSCQTHGRIFAVIGQTRSSKMSSASRSTRK